MVPDVPFVRVAPFADIWVPTGTAKSSLFRHELVADHQALFVARSTADLPIIRAAFQERLKSVTLPDPKEFDHLYGGAETLFEAASRLFGPIRVETAQPALLRTILFALAVLFMTLPALNLANINLSRILERSSEIGVRKAFGASSRTLVGQFVVENVVLTLIGAGFSLLLSALALRALNASGLIAYARLELNWRIFLYGLAIALFFGVLSGVYPAWRMSKLHPVQALRGRPL